MQDQPGIVSAAQKLAKDVPDAKLIELPEAAHYVQIERPDLVAKVLTDLAKN